MRQGLWGVRLPSLPVVLRMSAPPTNGCDTGHNPHGLCCDLARSIVFFRDSPNVNGDREGCDGHHRPRLSPTLPPRGLCAISRGRPGRPERSELPNVGYRRRTVREWRFKINSIISSALLRFVTPITAVDQFSWQLKSCSGWHLKAVVWSLFCSKSGRANIPLCIVFPLSPSLQSHAGACCLEWSWWRPFRSQPTFPRS